MANHSEVKLHSYKGDVSKEWYIGFRYYSDDLPGGKEFQVRFGINYKKQKSERLAVGKSLCIVVEQSLNDGWDSCIEPLKKYLKRKSESNNATGINYKTFTEAIDFALSNGSWATKTTLDYKGTAKFFKKAAADLGITHIHIQKITKQHIMQLAMRLKKNRNWSNAAYNKNVVYFSGILSVLVNWDIIPHNSAHDIKKLPVAETNKYEPYTKAEKEKIYDALHEKYYLFYVFFMVVYHAGARPKEVLALKIKDIRFDINEIHIIPDLEEENSKTKKIRRIPINPHLLTLLESLELGKHSKDSYVFGSPYGKGSGNRGHEAKHPGYFKPSTTRIKRDTVTKLWKELIWEGAGVHKYLYAAKHTGGDDKILAGVDLDALRDLYGHSSKQMTEKYISRLQEVHKKKIIEKSPDFL